MICKHSLVIENVVSKLHESYQTSCVLNHEPHYILAQSSIESSIILIVNLVLTLTPSTPPPPPIRMDIFSLWLGIIRIDRSSEKKQKMQSDSSQNFDFLGVFSSLQILKSMFASKDLGHFTKKDRSRKKEWKIQSNFSGNFYFLGIFFNFFKIFSRYLAHLVDAIELHHCTKKIDQPRVSSVCIATYSRALIILNRWK